MLVGPTIHDDAGVERGEGKPQRRFATRRNVSENVVSQHARESLPGLPRILPAAAVVLDVRWRRAWSGVVGRIPYRPFSLTIRTRLARARSASIAGSRRSLGMPNWAITR
jgi:hypothetical protein